MTKLTPRVPGFFLFKGTRKIKDSIYEHLNEPVQVKKHTVGTNVGLAVCMTGRSTKWPICNFCGEWTEIRLEETV